MTLGGIVTGLSLREAVRRPRNGAEPAIVVAGDEVRRRAVVSILAGAGLGVWAMLGTVTSDLASLTAELAPATPSDCGPGLPAWWSSALTGLSLLSLVMATVCAARLLVPGSRRPMPAARELVNA